MHPDLAELGSTDALALYLHVPFCRSKCDYCDFFSRDDVPGEVQQRVIEESINQAENLLGIIGHPKIETIFIGGGTPTSLSSAVLEYLITSLCGLSEGGRTEFTCEANPESVSRESLSILKNGGVTRLSLGVQSFDDHTLAFLGRVTTGKEIRNSLEMIEQVWEGELNIDVISEIPGQEPFQCIRDIENALPYGPDHLSVYSLQVEEGTPLYSRMMAEDGFNPTRDLPMDMLSSFLSDNGYSRYEISNYAMPGKESRHNLAYWRMRPYLGCGPGAVSTVPGKTGILRLENPKDIDLFLNGSENNWGVHVEEVLSQDFLLEYLMMGLRLTSGIQLKGIEEIFGTECVNILKPLFQLWHQEGQAILTSDRICLTSRGLEIMNPLLLQLMEPVEHFTAASPRWP